MLIKPIDHYFHNQPEPIKSYLLSLRELILGFDQNVSEKWSYGMPFYCYKEKRFCYLWVHKKFQKPYLGIVDGNLIDMSEFISEDRKRMKILLLNPEKDIPVKMISAILRKLIPHYN